MFGISCGKKMWCCEEKWNDMVKATVIGVNVSFIINIMNRSTNTFLRDNSHGLWEASTNWSWHWKVRNLSYVMEKDLTCLGKWLFPSIKSPCVWTWIVRKLVLPLINMKHLSGDKQAHYGSKLHLIFIGMI